MKCLQSHITEERGKINQDLELGEEERKRCVEGEVFLRSCVLTGLEKTEMSSWGSQTGLQKGCLQMKSPHGSQGRKSKEKGVKKTRGWGSTRSNRKLRSKYLMKGV